MTTNILNFNSVSIVNSLIIACGLLVKHLTGPRISKKNLFKIKTYPVVIAENIRSYIKPTIFKKSDLSLVHSETNNLTNRINTMTKVYNVLTTAKEIYKDKKIKFGQKQSSGGTL